MDAMLQGMKRKIDVIYDVVVSSAPADNRVTVLEMAIKRAIDELDKTRSSFKSRQIMQIREDLIRALNGR